MQIADVSQAELMAALKHRRLTVTLGAFRQRIGGESRALVKHLMQQYAFAGASDAPYELTDHSIDVRPTNLLRRFVRRSVVVRMGFENPIIPMAARLAPLAAEMGLNLSVALTTYRFMIFHSAVLAPKSGGAVILSAESGSGKSTMAAHLANKGWRLLSDEFALIDMEEGRLHPYPRPISLKNSAIALLRREGMHIGPIFSGTPRGDIAYAQVKAEDVADRTPLGPRLIVFPSFQADARAESSALSRQEAAMLLIESSPNYRALGEAAFTGLMNLVNQVPAYRMVYASSKEGHGLLEELLAEHPF